MQTIKRLLCAGLLAVLPWTAFAATLTIDGKDTVPLGQTIWFVGKLDGKGIFVNFSATAGSINSQNGRYDAPTVMPAGGKVTITATTADAAKLTATKVVSLTTSTSTTPTPTPTPTPSPTPTPVPIPATDAATISAARFLEQASFGPTAADIALVKQIGMDAWITRQLSAAVSPMPVNTAMGTLQKNWYMNMANGQDQLRQKMIFVLSQIFVVSNEKNPYANEIQPLLTTLQNNAFGNFNTLLREVSLNPAMGKYLDMGNSVIPAPNENYAREVMQLFTIGPVLLNMDGSVQTDFFGNPKPSYDQARIGDTARALSGWTYTGTSASGLNWENFTGPLQPRDAYHDKSSKTLVNGVVLRANQTTQQDFDAVMTTLFNHPNLPPFIATRLIRAFVTSNPSPAYITRVAAVFANSNGVRGDLAATLRAILLDPEARQDTPSSVQGHLKDPMLHSLSLIRALGGTVIDPTNLFWDYFLLGERLLDSPSVFNFYSPMTRLPGNATLFGPEFQIYAPSLAVARANYLYELISGDYASMIKIDITPYVNAAPNAATLIALVDATLLQGRMSDTARQAINVALAASTDNKQRAITALYLAAITAEFAVNK